MKNKQEKPSFFTKKKVATILALIFSHYITLSLGSEFKRLDLEPLVQEYKELKSQECKVNIDRAPIVKKYEEKLVDYISLTRKANNEVGQNSIQANEILKDAEISRIEYIAYQNLLRQGEIVASRQKLGINNWTDNGTSELQDLNNKLAVKIQEREAKDAEQKSFHDALKPKTIQVSKATTTPKPTKKEKVDKKRKKHR